MRQVAPLSVVLSVCFLPAAAFAQLAGDKIVVTTDKAPLGWAYKTPSGWGYTTTGTVPSGNILTVKHVNADWFWVIHSGETGTVIGWIYRSDVIPFSQALDFFNEEVKRNPTARAYNTRGMILQAKGEHDIAIGDFNEAIRRDPHFKWAFRNRGNAWKAKNEFDKATADYNEAIRLDPKYIAAWDSRAWLEAVSPNARFRDGKRAVEDAKRSLELARSKDDPELVDTLAAAYAESGDFASAVKWETRARDMAPEKEPADYQSRLDLYKAHKPYREQVKK
jgi:Tfp pilus assembly protein PilF